MNVLLVDDHRLMLEGLTNLLTAHGINVVGTAFDGLEAVARARALQPDVILMDIRMPHMDGLVATRLIRAENPQAKILILTTSAAEEDLFEAVKSGAFGYLLKTIDAAELIECLQEAQQGVPPFAPGLAGSLVFIQDGKALVQPCQVVAGCQAGLPATNDDRIERILA